MDASEFRRHAHELVEWMAGYMERVGDLPVVPSTAPGDIRRQLPASPPEAGEPFGRIFEDFRSIIMPGMTHWNHPRWFAYFPANNSPPSILAEMLMSTIGAQCMSWQTSPAATELEEVVMAWLGEMIGLPPEWRGVIQDTASTATLVALLSARERATSGAFGRDGAAAPGADALTVYASTECHSSVDKGVKLAGLGLDRLRRIPADDAFAMRPDALRAAMEADADAGLRPAAVVATVGSTSSTGVDPVAAIAPIARRHGAWLHVDAAYAGNAAICPERRHILRGIEGADSLVWNPHKWLLTNFDCSAYHVRDAGALRATMSTSPEYLRTPHDEEVRNFRDWGLQLGRRFRALKLWFVIRTYGVEGLRDVIRRHIALAEGFRARVESHPDFETLAPGAFGLVCFRWNPRRGEGAAADLDALNERLLAAVNDGGRVHLTHTRLGGRYAIRMSIGQRDTTAEDVDVAWRLILDRAATL